MPHQRNQDGLFQSLPPFDQKLEQAKQGKSNNLKKIMIHERNQDGLFQALPPFDQKLEQAKQLCFCLQQPTLVNGQRYYRDELDLETRPALDTVLKATWSRKSMTEWFARKNHSAGASFHKRLKLYFTKEPDPFHYCNLVNAYWDSVQHVLQKISEIYLVEQVVPWKGCLPYAAKPDFLGKYNGDLCTIQWTTSTEFELKGESLGDKLEQVVGETKALKDFYNLDISRALIVVAHPYGDAKIVTIERQRLADCWHNQLIPRLKRFYERQMSLAC